MCGREPDSEATQRRELASRYDAVINATADKSVDGLKNALVKAYPHLGVRTNMREYEWERGVALARIEWAARQASPQQQNGQPMFIGMDLASGESFSVDSDGGNLKGNGDAKQRPNLEGKE